MRVCVLSKGVSACFGIAVCHCHSRLFDDQNFPCKMYSSFLNGKGFYAYKTVYGNAQTNLVQSEKIELLKKKKKISFEASCTCPLSITKKFISGYCSGTVQI